MPQKLTAREKGVPGRAPVKTEPTRQLQSHLRNSRQRQKFPSDFFRRD
jgi:hypothetical protein